MENLMTLMYTDFYRPEPFPLLKQCEWYGQFHYTN